MCFAHNSLEKTLHHGKTGVFANTCRNRKGRKRSERLVVRTPQFKRQFAPHRKKKKHRGISFGIATCWAWKHRQLPCIRYLPGEEPNLRQVCRKSTTTITTSSPPGAHPIVVSRILSYNQPTHLSPLQAKTTTFTRWRSWGKSPAVFSTRRSPGYWGWEGPMHV